MKKEKQRIAIAEACGWKGRDHHPCGILSETGVYRVYSKTGFSDTTQLPDYLNDLNACHEFEKTLFPDDAQYSQWNFYSLHLGDLTNNDNGRGWKPLSNADCFRIANATAAQRCEAFLKTLDLWEDAE